MGTAEIDVRVQYSSLLPSFIYSPWIRLIVLIDGVNAARRADKGMNQRERILGTDWSQVSDQIEQERESLSFSIDCLVTSKQSDSHRDVPKRRNCSDKEDEECDWGEECSPFMCILSTKTWSDVRKSVIVFVSISLLGHRLSFHPLIDQLKKRGSLSFSLLVGSCTVASRFLSFLFLRIRFVIAGARIWMERGNCFSKDVRL